MRRPYPVDLLVGGLWAAVALGAIPRLATKTLSRERLISQFAFSIPAALLLMLFVIAAVGVIGGTDWGYYWAFALSTILLVLFVVGAFGYRLAPASLLTFAAMLATFLFGPLRVFGRLGPPPR